MTDVLDRAARALCLSSSEDGPEHVEISMELDGDDWRDHARAVLDAALDAKDYALIRAIADAIMGVIVDDKGGVIGAMPAAQRVVDAIRKHVLKATMLVEEKNDG